MNSQNKALSNTSDVLFGVVMSLLLTGCLQPTEIDSESNLSQPESVVENLALAYNEKNLKRYMEKYSRQISFFDGMLELWGYDTEKRIHDKLFEQATRINLEMQRAGDMIVTDSSRQSAYNYRMSLELNHAPATMVEGEVVLDFIKNEDDNWLITSFRERNGKLNKPSNFASVPDDSVDYFPLRVGNSWTYEEQFAPGVKNRKVVIEDSVMIKGNLLYQAAAPGYFFVISASFARQDSLKELILFVEDDSTERIIFDFAAAVGDSITFTPPNAFEEMVVELIGRKDSLAVPAGTFADVLEFLITDNNSGSRFLYEFAANIGLVRQRGTNQVMALKSAFINGKKYPVITHVKTKYTTWTQIKRRFR